MRGKYITSKSTDWRGSGNRIDDQPRPQKEAIEVGSPERLKPICRGALRRLSFLGSNARKRPQRKVSLIYKESRA